MVAMKNMCLFAFSFAFFLVFLDSLPRVFFPEVYLNLLCTEIKRASLFLLGTSAVGESQSRPARACPLMEPEAKDQGH